MSDGPYRVTIDPEHPGCVHCGTRPMWIIVDAVSKPFCGKSYREEAMADEDCTWFNVAWSEGKNVS